MNGIAALRVRRIGKAGLNIAGVDDGVGCRLCPFLVLYLEFWGVAAYMLRGSAMYS